MNHISSQYNVLKIPSGKVDLLEVAQNNGYKVVELSIEHRGEIDKIAIPPIYNRFMSDIEIEKADEKNVRDSFGRNR